MSDIFVEKLKQLPLEKQRIELVERKGLHFGMNVAKYKLDKD